LVVAHAVGVSHGNEDDTSAERFLDVLVGVDLVAVSQTDAVLVRIQQIRDEVDEVVRAAAFACMDTLPS
jgi:hypothetical protein